MFDGMDTIEACGDLFDYGVDNDHLDLIREADKEVIINVKTPQGHSKNETLNNRVLQGDTLATAMASTQVDSFGKKMLLEVPSYMYKFHSPPWPGGQPDWSSRGEM